MADPRMNWTVYEGGGGGSAEPIVRSFVLLRGDNVADEGPTPAPADPHEREIERIKTILTEAHEREIKRLTTTLNEVHEREIERLTGSRWTAAAAIHALVHPGVAGGHRLVDRNRVMLNIEVANLSPFTWEAVKVDCQRVGWADGQKANITWDDAVQASLADRVVPIACDFADPIKVTLRVSGSLSRPFAGSQRLHMEPTGINLVVRRSGSGKTETVPVRLAEGPIFLSQ